MLNLAIFEDNIHKSMTIRRHLENQDHKVVAEVSTIGKSFELLGEMATHELKADVILLDGHLSAGVILDSPVFEFTLPEEFNEINKKGFLRKRIVSTPKIIRVAARDYMYEGARDAKAIREVLTQLGSFGILATPTIISVSGESLAHYGVVVDYDLGAHRLSELPEILEEIEISKT